MVMTKPGQMPRAMARPPVPEQLQKKLWSALSGLLLLLLLPTHVLADDLPLAEIWRIIDQRALPRPKPEMERHVLEAEDVEQLREILHSFDPYANFIAAEEYQELLSMGEGFSGSIGMDIVHDREDRIFCIPYPGSAAQHSGMSYGDVLLAVDDQDVESAALEDVAILIRGQPGTEVQLRVRKQNGEERLLLIVRKQYPDTTVALEPVPGANPRIRLFRFGKKSAAELTDALAMVDPALPIVLDLRGNTGGSVQAAMDAARLFMPRQTALCGIQSRNGSRSEQSRREGPFASMKLHIWQDELTASAAELFIVAMRHAGRAKTIGQRSAGKGLVQELIRLQNGSLLKLTTESLLMPETSTTWQGIGLIPDIELDSQLWPDRQ